MYLHSIHTTSHLTNSRDTGTGSVLIISRIHSESHLLLKRLVRKWKHSWIHKFWKHFDLCAWILEVLNKIKPWKFKLKTRTLVVSLLGSSCSKWMCCQWIETSCRGFTVNSCLNQPSHQCFISFGRKTIILGFWIKNYILEAFWIVCMNSQSQNMKMKIQTTN